MSEQDKTDTAPDNEIPDPPNAESVPTDLGLVATFETLLKKPLRLLEALIGGGNSGAIVKNLIITTVVCLAVFGFVIGTFSMGTQLWAAPLKITLGMLVAGLICLPSLYIFSCLNGLDVKLSAVAGVLFATIALTSLLLLGFTPVVWIFSQSITSIAFMGTLGLAFWFIATCFGLGLINKTAAHLGMTKRTHLTVWMGIFILVSLQMMTTLRPIIGESEQLLTSEKKFFLIHWGEQLGESVDGAYLYEEGDRSQRRGAGSIEKEPVVEEENPWE